MCRSSYNSDGEAIWLEPNSVGLFAVLLPLEARRVSAGEDRRFVGRRGGCQEQNSTRKQV
jgi:hypothetical protein